MANFNWTSINKYGITNKNPWNEIKQAIDYFSSTSSRSDGKVVTCSGKASIPTPTSETKISNSELSTVYNDIDIMYNTGVCVGHNSTFYTNNLSGYQSSYYTTNYGAYNASVNSTVYTSQSCTANYGSYQSGYDSGQKATYCKSNYSALNSGDVSSDEIAYYGNCVSNVSAQNSSQEGGFFSTQVSQDNYSQYSGNCPSNFTGHCGSNNTGYYSSNYEDY